LQISHRNRVYCSLPCSLLQGVPSGLGSSCSDRNEGRAGRSTDVRFVSCCRGSYRLSNKIVNRSGCTPLVLQAKPSLLASLAPHPPCCGYLPVLCDRSLHIQLLRLLRRLRGQRDPVRRGSVLFFGVRARRGLLGSDEPLGGWRELTVTERRRKREFAHWMWRLVEEHYPQAEKIRVVLDNLSTHTGAAFYETFPAEVARKLAGRIEFCYKPGSTDS